MLRFLLAFFLTWIFLGVSHASDSHAQDETPSSVELVFRGSGAHTTKLFTVEDGWEIKWETESPSFKLLAHGTASRPYTGPTNEREKVLQWFEAVKPIVLANTTESMGHAFHPFGGTFYLKILAKGSWVLHLTAVKDTKDYLDVPYTGAP